VREEREEREERGIEKRDERAPKLAAFLFILIFERAREEKKRRERERKREKRWVGRMRMSALSITQQRMANSRKSSDSSKNSESTWTSKPQYGRKRRQRGKRQREREKQTNLKTDKQRERASERAIWWIEISFGFPLTKVSLSLADCKRDDGWAFAKKWKWKMTSERNELESRGGRWDSLKMSSDTILIDCFFTGIDVVCYEQVGFLSNSSNASLLPNIYLLSTLMIIVGSMQFSTWDQSWKRSWKIYPEWEREE
jgi:hypothetical protein